MTPRIIAFRTASRFLVALAVAMAICAVLLTMILYSEKLAGIEEAGWTVIGALGAYLGQALVSIARAIASNPSDRAQLTEEE